MNMLSQVTVPECVNVRLNYSQVLQTVYRNQSLCTFLWDGLVFSQTLVTVAACSFRIITYDVKHSS